MKGRIKPVSQDVEKLKRIYIEHRRFLLGSVAFPILKEEALSEDAVQETFARLIGHEDKIEENNVRKTRGFLATVCKHVAFDIYNSRMKLNKNANLADEIDTAPSHEDDLLTAYIAKEGQRALMDKIKTLEPMYQSVFYMKELFHYSYEEIGQILKVEPATARKRMERARVRLCKMVGEEEQK